MERLDYIVLITYFTAMALIGLLAMLKVKRQEDFFMGGRGFGKLLQTFAAFGAGTGSYEPVTVGRTTFLSGLSGIWSVLLWLFATPVYWIVAVWFRRMRHLTLGDWFVERYQSRGLGLAYACFGTAMEMCFLGLGFSAIGKVCAPLLGTKTFHLEWPDLVWPGLAWEATVGIECVLIPLAALIVLIYGVLGGLRAAYWTDLVQGVFIIILSVLLIPAGLNALVVKYGDPASMTLMDGFRIMHQQVPADFFYLTDTPQGGQFPLHYIVAIMLLNISGAVVHPHMIAVGGGSAKSEMSARMGLVIGALLKRLCTIGWALTTLIILAYMANSVEIAEDPDSVWGVAARELLGPMQLGLVGLMLACLMAALMSSADCYMLIVSALVVRNGYAAYINPHASDRTCLRLGRVVGVLVITGGAAAALMWYDIFEQLKTVWELPILFAAPFWIGMYWRRATPLAAWGTVTFSLLAFFVIPAVLPHAMPSLAENARYTATNELVTTIVTRPAVPADVARREAAVGLWHKKVRDWVKLVGAQDEGAAADMFGPMPEPIQVGQSIEDRFTTGGKPIYWKGRVRSIGPEKRREIDHQVHGNTVKIREAYDCPLQGQGSFQLDFLIYDFLNVDLAKMDNATLETLRLPTRLVLPFLVMIVLSLITPRSNREALDRYYVKMKTPVRPDPDEDRQALENSYQNPWQFDHRRLIPYFGLEFQKPRPIDVIGFVGVFLACFALIGLVLWLARLGT